MVFIISLNKILTNCALRIKSQKPISLHFSLTEDSDFVTHCKYILEVLEGDLIQGQIVAKDDKHISTFR